MYSVIIADNLFLDIGGFAGSRFNAFVRNDDSALQLVDEHFLRNQSICNSLTILASTPQHRFVHCIIALRRHTIALSYSYVGIIMLFSSVCYFIQLAFTFCSINIYSCSPSFSRAV